MEASPPVATAEFPARRMLLFAGMFSAYLLSSGFQDTLYNNYVLLADAWLHGHIWLASQISGIDTLFYHGHWYVIEAPLPAVLVLPLVIVFGLKANQVLVGALCAAVAVCAADALFERMGLDARARRWMLAFFAFGTVLWWCSAFGAVWMFAHVAGAMFALLMLAECYGRKRPWLIGLMLACAALCRFPIGLALFPVLYWFYTSGRLNWKALASFCVAALPLLVAYAAYNYARWHTFSDIGYTLWYHQDEVGLPTGSPFRLRYLPFDLYSFFMLPPQYVNHFPWLQPTSFGVALTFTSPALALAFLTPLREREGFTWWSAVALTAAPSLFYYVNGFEQFGMRHSLDFTPFLLPLVARGFARFPGGVARALIVLSVCANAYGLWYSWTYHSFTVVPR